MKQQTKTNLIDSLVIFGFIFGMCIFFTYLYVTAYDNFNYDIKRGLEKIQLRLDLNYNIKQSCIWLAKYKDHSALNNFNQKLANDLFLDCPKDNYGAMIFENQTKTNLRLSR